MQPVDSIRAGATPAALILALVLTAGASAQERSADPTPPFQPALESGAPSSAAVLYDEPGDGRLWASGTSWKASFGAGGATYWPRTVTTRSLPHALSPESVTVGGVPLAFERVAPATRCGDRVEMDRVSFVEAYELGAQSVEQLFVFASMPRAGELVLRIPVVSDPSAVEMQAAETDAGIELRSATGRVTYSRAVAIDARGERVQAETRVENGLIVIHVSAEFLAQAAYPLVIDPLLNAIFPEGTTADTFSSDAVYDTFNSIWFLVYERVFSATDHDVYAKMYGADGTLLGTSVVDNTTDSWTAPRIAYMRAGTKCLIVASVADAGQWVHVDGRFIQSSGTGFAVGFVLAISDSTSAQQVRLDVGGDPAETLGSSWFCVVWEQSFDAPVFVRRINYQLVGLNGIPVFSHALDLQQPPGVMDASPSVSKSNGGARWLITFQRDDNVMHGDIYGVYLDFTGQPEQLPFPIFTGPGFEASPSASSPIQMLGPVIPTTKYAVAWESGQSPDRDIRVAYLQGSTVTQVINLSALEHTGWQTLDQIEPSIDSDGTQFLVSYSEFDPSNSVYELKVTDLVLQGNALSIAQNHLALHPGLGFSQRRSQVAASRASGALAQRYLTTYDVRQSDQDHDLAGRFVDSSTHGSWVPFCFGDGSGSACPCGNIGIEAQGCGNSVFPGGASLSAVAGTPLATDTSVQLQAISLPPNAPCLFFQGTGAGAGAVFGDGLRCVNGSVTRLTTGKTSNAGGGALYPTIGEQPLVVQGSVPPQGGMRTYQVWYRNAPNFCTPLTFNLTNGFQIFWAP